MEQNQQGFSGPGPGQGQPSQSSGKNIGMAIVAYILFFIPLLTDAKNDPFVKYHVKQGLVLFISGFVIMVVSWMPIIRWFAWILNLGIFVLFIIGVINAATGKEKPLPLIGHFADKFNF